MNKKLLNRMLELSNIKPVIKEEKMSLSNFELVKESVNGKIYAVVREQNKYYIKNADSKNNINESDFDYIGGIVNKGKKSFYSYEEAVKHLNLMFEEINNHYNVDNVNLLESDVLNEKKFILKLKNKKTEPKAEPKADKGGFDFGGDSEEKETSDKGGFDFGGGDDTEDTGDSEFDFGGGDDTEDTGDDSFDFGGDGDTEEDNTEDTGDGEFDFGGDDEGDDSEEDDTDVEEFGDDDIKDIQSTTGKLGQQIRDVEDLSSDMQKWVAKSVLSAMDLENMDSEDKKDIIRTIKKKSQEEPEESDEESFDFGDEEPVEESSYMSYMDDEEELEQSGYNIGYNAADDLLTLLGDESQDIIIKGFMEGFNSWGIDEIKIVKTGEEPSPKDRDRRSYMSYMDDESCTHCNGLGYDEFTDELCEWCEGKGKFINPNDTSNYGRYMRDNTHDSYMKEKKESYSDSELDNWLMDMEMAGFISTPSYESYMGEDNPHIGGDEDMNGELLLDYNDEPLYGLNKNMSHNNMNNGYGNYMSDVTDKFESYEQEIAYQDLLDMASEYGFTLSLCHADKTEDPEESTIYFDIKDGSEKLLKARINSIGSLEIGTMRGKHFIGEPVDSLSDFDETFDEEGKLKDMGPQREKAPEKPDRGTETIPGTPTKTPDRERPSRRPFNPPPHITPGEEPGPKARGRRLNNYDPTMAPAPAPAKQPEKPDRGTETVPGTPTKTPDKDRPSRRPFNPPPHITPGEEPGTKARGGRSYMSYMGDEDKTPQPTRPPQMHGKGSRPSKMPFQKPTELNIEPRLRGMEGKNRPNINEDDVEFS
jgi:uncharacterized protein YfkK (UPF0435 family)